MHAWKVTSDPRTGGYTHALADDRGRSLLSLISTSLFRTVGVPASFWDGEFWWLIHDAPSVITFEQEHGVEAKRYAYNGRSLEKARKSGKIVHGEHCGFHDFFVPVTVGGRVTALLVVGPFATVRPTSERVIDSWRALTGRKGSADDAEFAAYLRTTLATPVIERSLLGKFRRWLEGFAALVAGGGRADALTNKLQALMLELENVRFVERMWDAVREMLDERTTHVRYSAANSYDLGRLGLSRAADQVLVGLARSRSEAVDPIRALIVRDALQRACVEVARTERDLVAGRVGDHGVVFLSARTGSPRRRRRELGSLAERVNALARSRFGLNVHFGAQPEAGSTPLSQSYQAALAAAESALATGARIEFGPAATQRGSLGELRTEMARDVLVAPSSLPARFDRYLEAVTARSGYRIEAAQAQLDAGLERVADALLDSGVLDKRSHAALHEAVERWSNEARTVDELCGVYRRAAADLVAAVERPTPARHQRAVKRALDHIHTHYGEPLTLNGIARLAGFTPKYFSELFRKEQRTTFERYLAELRLERAKQLLVGTDLRATQIAKLSGHRTPQQLCHVFRRALGSTPTEFRRSNTPSWRSKQSTKN